MIQTPNDFLTKVISATMTISHGSTGCSATLNSSSCCLIHLSLLPYFSANWLAVCLSQTYCLQRAFCKGAFLDLLMKYFPQSRQKYFCLLLKRPFFLVCWELHFGQNRLFFCSHSVNYLLIMALLSHKMQFLAPPIYYYPKNSLALAANSLFFKF